MAGNLNAGTVTTSVGVIAANFSDATRPSTGSKGQVIYNTDSGICQVWDGLAWVNIDQFGGPFKATGGNIKDTSAVANYTLHVFTSSGEFEVSAAPPGAKIDVLIVGGGGGGGGGANSTWHGGGGGGAGQVRLKTQLAVNAGDKFTVVIGNGGNGGTGNNNPGGNGSAGGCMVMWLPVVAWLSGCLWLPG